MLDIKIVCYITVAAILARPGQGMRASQSGQLFNCRDAAVERTAPIRPAGDWTADDYAGTRLARWADG